METRPSREYYYIIVSNVTTPTYNEWQTKVIQVLNRNIVEDVLPWKPLDLYSIVTFGSLTKNETYHEIMWNSQ